MMTYDLGGVVFQASHDKVHVFIQIAEAEGRLPWQPHVFFIFQVTRSALQIEGLIIMVYNLEKCFVLWFLGHCVYLLFEGRLARIASGAELIPVPHNNYLLLGLHGLFGQVS